MDLEFSKTFTHTLPTACRWSPNGRYVASASKYQLIVRDASAYVAPPSDEADHPLLTNKRLGSGDLDILHIFACRELIEEVRWAPDSQLILCASYSRRLVQVFSLTDPEWSATIDEDLFVPSGLTAVRWSPDSRHLLFLTDFQLFVLVWSLAAGSEVQSIPHPKFSWTSVLETPEREGNSDVSMFVRSEEQDSDLAGLRGLHFSHRGRYMAVAQRENCKDYISIYDCVKQWVVAKRIAVDTQDMSDFAWSPDDRFICAWEAPHMPYKVLLYPLSGPAAAPGQKKVQSYSAYKDQLSIKTVSWSPDTQYIAIGSYDQTVRLINSRTWKVELELKHNAAATRGADTTVYREIERWRADGEQDPDEQYLYEREPKSQGTVYGINDDPVEFASVRNDPQKANPELGIGMLSWSHDGSHFFTRNDSVPNVLWVWDAVRMSLAALLMQKHAIKSARWHPTQTKLALCTSNRAIYMWSPSCCLSSDLPRGTKLHVRDVVWNPSGSSVLLIDRKAFAACVVPAMD